MSHSGMNVVDLAVFGIIVLSGLLAMMRGFVREVVALAAWSGAGAVTVYLYPSLRPWMHEHIKTPLVADIATGLALFCVALAILIPIGHLLSSFVQGRALTAVDRSLGFVFGLARGVLVVCLAFMLSLWMWPDKEKEPEQLAAAKTRPMLAEGARTLDVLLPKEDLEKMSSRLRDIDPAPPTLQKLTTPTIAGSDNVSGGKIISTTTNQAQEKP